MNCRKSLADSLARHSTLFVALLLAAAPLGACKTSGHSQLADARRRSSAPAFNQRQPVINFTLTTAAGSVVKKANFLARGASGFAYITQDNQVLKVPDVAVYDDFLNEVKLFTDTTALIAKDQSNARHFADYLVSATKQTVSITDETNYNGKSVGSYRGPVLIKQLAAGAPISDFDADAAPLKAQLDQFYQSYKDVYKNLRLDIDDLHEENIYFEPASGTLTVIDGNDITNASYRTEFTTLCRAGAWCAERAQKDPEVKALDALAGGAGRSAASQASTPDLSTPDQSDGGGSDAGDPSADGSSHADKDAHGR